jgi:hypothetical protein
MVCGVMVSSRYRKAEELEVVRRMILALPPQLGAAVVEVFRDSKAATATSATGPLRRPSPSDWTLRPPKSAAGTIGIDARDRSAPDLGIVIDPGWQKAF